MHDELIAVEVNSVSFGAQTHHKIEKHGLLQNQCIDQYCSSSAHKPCADALISIHDDTRFLHRTCEDALFSPTRHETVQFAFEGTYPHHQPLSSASLVRPRIKLLCSIGGRIMVRPVDGKLRYCGGETRVIAVDRGLCFAELMGKMTHVYGSPLSMKYQLPGEDLDALVSVSSDDDLQNMLDEYDKLVASNGNSWLRVFLFASPLQSEILYQCNIGHGREDCCADAMQHYIGAINGVANNGVLELVADGHIVNGVLGHHSHQRMPLDIPSTIPAGPYFSKPALCALSAPSSTPSSPSVASRQAHHQLCGTLDMGPQFSKDQMNCITPINGFDMSTPEASLGTYMDAAGTLKGDHQGHIPVESPRIQPDTPFSRGDAMRVKENGSHSGDPQELFLQRHRGTGTFLMDIWHDVQKSYGLTNSPCEVHCGNQPATLFARQGQMEDDFGRVESLQHCQSEGHKQLPALPHQVISPLQREGPARLQRGSDYESSCQNIDSHGPLPFSKEFTHPHTHTTHVVGTIPMGSAPSSPRDPIHGRCSCYWQHSQVHRGISVSLGEHSHSKQPIHIGDQYIRKHGLPLLSRFCDSSNLSTDPATWYCVPNLGKDFELDEQDQVTCARKHIFDRSKSRCHLVDCHAKEKPAYHGDSHAVMEPSDGLYERSMRPHVCADYHEQKGQHVEMTRGFPFSTEFQSHMGEHATHLRSNELDSANVFTAGNLTHIMPPQDYKGGLNKEGLYFNHGQGALDTGMLDVCDGVGASMLKISHVSPGSSTLGYKEPDCDLNSASFSSTDAVAGSLSGPSLEPPVWVASPPLAANEEFAKEREICTLIPAVDCMGNSMHLVDGTYNYEEISLGTLKGNTCKNPSFSCMESYARARSKSTSGEPKAEHLPISAVNHVPERSLDQGSTSYAHESVSADSDHLGSLGPSQPLPSRTLDPVTLEGSAVTLTSPTYDRSSVNSIENANFSFAKGEGPVVDGVITDEKEATSQVCFTEQCRTSSFINSHSNEGQHHKSGKGDGETARQAIFEQEIKPVSEESRSLLRPSSKQHSAEEGAYPNWQGSRTGSMVQSIETSEIVQEEQVGGLVNLCIKEDEEELPAKQAEAEAIARGLQIIRNDDLEDLKELGSGTYGTVFHGKWRGSDVAIKRIKASCFMGHPSVQERLISDFWKEAGMLSQLHHPNVVAFYGIVPDGPGGTLATVTEYMVNGSLRQVLVRKDRTIDRKKRLLIAMDAAFGMEYLHSKKIVHFDLKSENLLVNMRDAHRPICKVGDFGLSKVKHRTLVSGGVRGTLPWMAPELLSGKSLVTEKVDVYSFGIVMWELLTGEEPYANMHCGTIIGGIVNNTLRPAIPSWCDPSWRELMERCWSGNPADRPDFSVVTSELRAIALSMNMK